ncbi:hypothetical protein [Nonomuraea fuscirosea]|uniref:hypothetical protein n=1 Tax=Nonomuraea fuscirosea TaxID=1291556 RepID=UPI0033CE9A2E
MLDHYRALFRRYPWLADSACWTVVQPFDDELTPDDLLWRLNGGRDPEERTLDHPMETALDEDLTMLYVFEGDGGYGFLECQYGRPLSGELLRTLSEDARVWTTSWSVNGASTMCCAGGGKIQAQIWNHVLGDRIDEEGAPDVLADFRAHGARLHRGGHRGRHRDRPAGRRADDGDRPRRSDQLTAACPAEGMPGPLR